jgi:16S rRNA (guanine(966)-N(2))-methyltransferase RsmD
MIRVIAGDFKGRRLKFIRSPLIRPMQDKVKGALFNILQADVPGSWFLDGFAGTGSVGIEALSRGAERVVFVEELRAAAKVVAANVATCGADDRALVIVKEFNRAVIDLSKSDVLFDIVFLDPPYRLLETRNPLKVVRKRGILREGGMLIMRHYFKIRPKSEGFLLRRTVSLGDDILSFFVQAPPSAELGRPALRP